MKLIQEQIDDHFAIFNSKGKKLLHLFGFASTSLDEGIARDFMNKSLDSKDQTRILYEITWDWEFDYWVADSGSLSHEREVILNDGTTFEIKNIEKKQFNKNEIYY